jgi:hypothetical protein
MRIALLLMAALLAGCARVDVLYHSVTLGEMRNRLELERKDVNFAGFYYVGSDDRQHFMVIKRNKSPDLRYALFKEFWKPATERHFFVPEGEWIKLEKL